MTKATDDAAAAPDLVLTRIFDAPPRLVFSAWTDPERLAQWWGPNGYTNPACRLDARPGGTMFIEMTSPTGDASPVHGFYREFDEPRRLVFVTSCLEDETGDPGLEVLNTVTFDEYQGKTKLTFTAVVTKAAPRVAAAVATMDDGWSQSLDRLGAALKGMQS